MATVIPFPAHRVTRVFTGTLPADATPREEATFRVRKLRAERDSYSPEYRQHHVAAIMLDWWERELARLVTNPAPPTSIKEARL